LLYLTSSGQFYSRITSQTSYIFTRWWCLLYQ